MTPQGYLLAWRLAGRRLAPLLALALLWPAVAHADKDKDKKKKSKKTAAPAKVVEPEREIEMTPDPPPPPPVVAEVKEEPNAEVSTDVIVAVPPSLERAHARKRFYLFLGAAFVDPLSSSQPLELADVDGAASLAVKNGPIAGSGSTVSSATIPAAILGYVLPFGGDRFSIETVLGTPFTVKFQATGTLKDMSIAPSALGIPTGVPALGSELGEAKAAPPVITAVYQVAHLGPVTPYVGAGVAVLIAFGAKITNPILTEVSQPSMHLDPAPGLVFQGGLEARLAKRIFARLDFKYIAFMEARATVEHIQVRTPSLPVFDTVEVGTAKMNVWVNPLIIQGGVGFDF